MPVKFIHVTLKRNLAWHEPDLLPNIVIGCLLISFALCMHCIFLKKIIKPFLFFKTKILSINIFIINVLNWAILQRNRTTVSLVRALLKSFVFRCIFHSLWARTNAINLKYQTFSCFFFLFQP